MRSANPWLTTIVVVLLVCGVACNRSKKVEQLAALDRGLAAGLLTKDEYEAKKAVVLGSVATPPAPPSPAPAASVPAAPAASTSAIDTPKPPEPAPAAIPNSTHPNTATKPAEPAPAAPPKVATRADSATEEAEPSPLPGCSDTGMKPGKEKGKQERFFPMPVARVKKAAVGALEALEFKINSDSGREIDASKKRHIGVIGSGGEKMVLRFEDAEERHQRGTRVTGETKKGFLLRAGQKSWTNAVLAQTGCLLRQGVSGR